MTIEQTYPVNGMHCASCSNIITRKLKKLSGVIDVTVNYATEKARVTYDSKVVTLKEMNAQIQKLGYSLTQVSPQAAKISQHTMPDGSMMSGSSEMGMDHSAHLGLSQTKDEKLKELEDKKLEVEFTLPISLLMFAITFWDIAGAIFPGFPPLPIPMRLLNPILMLLTSVILFGPGKHFVAAVFRFIRFREANMDTLVGIGTLAAYAYSTLVTLFPAVALALRLPIHTYYDVSIVIIGFILLGKYLEAQSKLQTGEAIAKLMELQVKTAIVKRDGKEVEIPIDQVLIGDEFIVKPGQKVAVDGKVLSGSSSIDESMLTGESFPISKKIGDLVIGGTVNKQGHLTVKATKVGNDTVLSQIIAMVEEAQGSKAPIEGLADRISSQFVPAVLGFAVVTALVWMIAGVIGLLPFAQAFSYAFIAVIGILVIACPCALGLATPTAIIVGIGEGARRGILVKDAKGLELLHTASVVVFDKTGTLTQGKPQVTDIVVADGQKEDDVLGLAASIEKLSSHPLADAIVQKAVTAKVQFIAVKEFVTVDGKGVSGIIEKDLVLVGNTALLEDAHITFDLQAQFDALSSQGKTVMAVSKAKKLIGLIAVADVVKSESKQTISRLHKLGLQVAMITGDHADVANFVARQLGIDTIYSQVLPQDKAAKVKELQKNGQIVAMVGDGINDAPALAQADVGIAMATGTDVAMEAADITLLKGSIEKTVVAIELSKQTFAVIKQNLFWAFGYNVVGIPIAAGILYPLFGIFLSPVFAGAAMALSSVSVVTNSLRLKRMKIG